MKRLALAVFLSQLFAAAAFAQSAGEFGQASGGSIDTITKHSSRLSGSLSLSAGVGKGYDATLGGTLVPDRVWFFASAAKNDSFFGPRRMTDTEMTANLGDRQNLAAAFASTRTQSTFTPGTIPSSFLSLHYTGIVTNNMFVTASFSELHR